MTATVVVYSKAHFDPQSQTEAAHSNSSAGHIARAVYRAATSLPSKVHYLDANDYESWPCLAHVRYLISIEAGFIRAQRKYNPDRSLLVAVNQAPSVAFGKWTLPIRKERLPLRALCGSYEIHSRDPRAVSKATKILMVGDNVTYGSYLTKRRAIDLHVVSYGYPMPGNEPSNPNGNGHILVPQSAIGVRKGADFVSALLSEIDQEPDLSGLRVVLLGTPTNNYWRAEIGAWKNNPAFLYVDWLKPGTEEHRDVYRGAICAVLPSREEGLVGSGMETIRAGIPTFSTLECGLGLRPIERSLVGSDIRQQARQVLEFCQGSLSVDHRPDPSGVHGRFHSMVQIEDAVKRFLTDGDVVPKLHVDGSGAHLALTRWPSTTSRPLKSWLDKVKDHEAFDGVLVAINILETNPSLNEVEIETHLQPPKAPANQVWNLIVGSSLPGSSLGVEIEELSLDMQRIRVHRSPQQSTLKPREVGRWISLLGVQMLKIYVLHFAFRTTALRGGINRCLYFTRLRRV